MAQDHGVGLHVAANEPGMRLAGLDDLGIGEAQAHGIVAHQELIRPRRGRIHLDRLAVQAKVLQLRAIEGPEPVLGRYCRLALLVGG